MGAILVRAMLADGLVGELHLFVFPPTLGTGSRLFLEDSEPLKLSLAASDSHENGAVHIAYKRG